MSELSSWPDLCPDTLFKGVPGATGPAFASFDTIIGSIRTTLLTLPGGTEVRTGHRDCTRMGAESPPRRMDLRKGLTTEYQEPILRC